jgi:hypothetical protein
MDIRIAIAVMVLASAAGLSGTARHARAGEAVNPADFSAVVDNQLFPLSTLRVLEYAGEEQDSDTGETIATRGVITILPDRQRTIAGVQVLVARDEAFADGELVESTLDYFAQHRDGTVYYFGEDVDNYEDGRLVDHEGSWLAGDGQNLPGIFMPAAPAVGARFDQERAPGIAEDHSTVLETGLTVTVPAGDFTGCIKTEDVDPIGNASEHKWYCPAVGLVKEQAEDELNQLVDYSAAAASVDVAPVQEPSPATASAQPAMAPNAGSGAGVNWAPRIGTAAGMALVAGLMATLAWAFVRRAR